MNSKVKELEIALLETDGEITEELQDLYKEALNEQNTTENISWMLSKYEQAVALMEERKKKLDIIKKKLETADSAIEFWKSQIDSVLKANTISDLQVDEYRLNYRVSESVDIADEELIPEYYKKEMPIVKKLDKILIKKDLKEGKEIIGADLKTSYKLQIKI